MTQYPIGQYVRNGWEFFGQHYPGFKTRLDPDNLDMTTMTDCPGGQVHGDVQDLIEVHELTFDQCIELGLVAPTNLPEEDLVAYSDLLEQTWKNFIRQQQRGFFSRWFHRLRRHG